MTTETIVDLAAVGEATRSAQGYTFIPEEQLKTIDPQLVEFDTKLRNKDNHIAIRCSPAGLKFLASFEQPKPIGLPKPAAGFTNGVHVAPISTQEVRDKFPLVPAPMTTEEEAKAEAYRRSLIDLTHVKPAHLSDAQVEKLGITPTDLRDVGVGQALGNTGLNSLNWPISVGSPPGAIYPSQPADFRDIGAIQAGHGPTPAFPISRGVPIPDIQLKRAKKESPYPFDKLGDPDVAANVYDSFFIPTSLDIPNPAKKFGSTVSNANKKLAPKRFLIRTVEGGARVWRTV